MTESYPVSIKGVLLTPRHEVVLLLNERDEWELPGGRVEPGELPAECLAREVREELGVEVAVGVSIDSYVFEVIPGRHVFIETYGCSLMGDFKPTISHEHTQWGLFALSELPSNLPMGYRHSIEAVAVKLAGIRGSSNAA